MKRLIYPVIVAMIALSVYSCKRDDVLPEQPEPAAFETVESISTAVDALYRTGAPTFFGESTATDGPMAAAGGYLSGLFYNESGSGVSENCRQLALDGAAMTGYVDKVWKQAYAAIAQCNDVINNASKTPDLTDEDAGLWVAEARFFRAFNYFYLAKAFGGVPVVTKGSIPANAQKSDLSKVYELIVADLMAAVADLPDEAFVKNDFRVARTSAQTLLADVYLTMSGWPLKQDHYKQAAQTAGAVIKSGKHTLAANGTTSGTSAYNKLRTQKDNPEYIYSYKTAGISASRSLAALCLSKDASNWGVLKTGTDNAYMPSQALLAVYDPYYDLRVKDQQFFHSFCKYDKNGRTVIQTFGTMPYWWFDREALFGSGTAQQDVIIYRYAEVLLIAAEAIAMCEGVTAEAAGYLADVRTRAYTKLDRQTICDGLAALDRDKFLEELWTERLREFPFEMKIWPDIQRTRKYPVTSSDDKGVVISRDIIGAMNSAGVPFAEKHLLFPVPVN
jgi:hypothetical protein